MTVFPEKMKPIDGTRFDAALAVVEKYLRYMAERVEFVAGAVVKRLESAEGKMERLTKNAPLTSDVPPDSGTAGSVGQLAVCEGAVYVCTDVTRGDSGYEYTWKEIG